MELMRSISLPRLNLKQFIEKCFWKMNWIKNFTRTLKFLFFLRSWNNKIEKGIIQHPIFCFSFPPACKIHHRVVQKLFWRQFLCWKCLKSCSLVHALAFFKFKKRSDSVLKDFPTCKFRKKNKDRLNFLPFLARFLKIRYNTSL